MENIDPNNEMRVYYQINYTLTEVPEDAAYFHAQFRRSNPNINSDHVLVDGIKGKGQYVGTYIAWQVNNNGWWGEGEIKFFMDGDKKFPTICGTGTEDYFCGSYNFEIKRRINMKNSLLLMQDYIRLFAQMEFIVHNNVLACIVGTYLIQSVLKRI